MLKKDELVVNILKEVGVPLNEGQSTVVNSGNVPRIVFYEIVWDDVIASGNSYLSRVTYQIDFYSTISRHPRLLKLRKLLQEKGINPVYNHTYIDDGRDQRFYQTYFAVEVLEDLDER